MRRPRQAPYRHEPRERSFGGLLLTMLGLVAIIAIGIVTWLFVTDRDLLLAKPQASTPDAKPVLARYQFDAGELTAPTKLVTRIKRKTLGNITKLDLLLPWPYQPGIIPKLPETASEFNDWIILVLETASKEDLTPVERYGEIYPVYFEGDPEKVEGNLLRYKFKEDSPYADLTLYVASVGGKHVIHRCDREPSVLGPKLCERTIPLNSRINLRIRFAREHLPRWSEIEQNVRLAMANMFASRLPGS